MFNISIVVPLYNEEEIFPLLIQRLNNLVGLKNEKIEIVLVNDGSNDGTESLMQQVGLMYSNYNCISFARNFGHQTALTAGLSVSRGIEAILIIDGDLQDPPELLTEMLQKLRNGYDVVYAVRKKREASILKKLAYKIFYRILNAISYIKIPLDSGDFSLLSRRAVDVLNAMPEQSRYLRGMRAWIGFEQISIEYERSERTQGETKYSIKKLIQLAYLGIFNFSTFPIKIIKRIGYASIIFSIIYSIYVLYKKVFYNNVPEGFTSLILVIMFFYGIQMFFMGIIGEYLLSIFFQVKGRPLFIIKSQIKDGKVNSWSQTISPLTNQKSFLNIAPLAVAKPPTNPPIKPET